VTPRLLTYQQAADALAVSPKTISRRVKAGSMAVVIDGGLRRIPEASLSAYVEARTLPAREPGGRPRRAAQSTRRRPEPGNTSEGRVRRLWEGAESG